MTDSSANDGSSFEAIELYHKAKLRFGEIVWATVSRYDGLVLRNAQGRELKFRTPLCGYGGCGPQATIAILKDAGFGAAVARGDLNLTEIITLSGDLEVTFIKQANGRIDVVMSV